MSTDLESFSYIEVPPWNRKSWDQRWKDGRCDMILALIPLTGLLMQVLFAAANHLNRAHGLLKTKDDVFDAFDLASLANDFCGCTLNMLVICVWSTICLQTTTCQHIWSWNSWIFGGRVMSPLGFVPYPAALSSGFLLFVSGVFIKERVVTGEEFFSHPPVQGEWCRADILEVANFDAEGQWLSRFKRSLPNGCYFGRSHVWGGPMNFSDQAVVPHMFNFTGNHSNHPENLKYPYAFSGASSWTMFNILLGVLPPWMRGRLVGFEHEELTIDPSHVCMYQCVKWKSWGFQELMSKLAVVFAGAGVVTKGTESVTGVLGVGRVKVHQKPDEVRSILRKIKDPILRRCLHLRTGSCAFCAWLLTLIRLSTTLLYKVDDHGMYTVDFYVSQTLIFSVITATILRSFNPYTLKFLAYTDDLWKKGVETFHIQGRPKGEHSDGSVSLQIDLRMWFHLSHHQRNYLLISHARCLNSASKAQVGKTVECIVPFKYEKFVRTRDAGGEQKLNTHELKIGLHDKGEIMSIRGDTAQVAWNKADIDIWGETLWDDSQLGRQKAWTAPINVSDIMLSDEFWGKLIEDYVGTPQEVMRVNHRIMAQYSDMLTNAKLPSWLGKCTSCVWWVIDKCCCGWCLPKETKDKTGKKDAKRVMPRKKTRAAQPLLLGNGGRSGGPMIGTN